VVTTRNKATVINLIVACVEDGMPFTYRLIGGRHVLDDAKPATTGNAPEILSDATTGAAHD